MVKLKTNITTEMNTSQMAIQEEQDMTEDVPTHNYIFRPNRKPEMARTGETT